MICSNAVVHHAIQTLLDHPDGARGDRSSARPMPTAKPRGNQEGIPHEGPRSDSGAHDGEGKSICAARRATCSRARAPIWANIVSDHDQYACSRCGHRCRRRRARAGTPELTWSSLSDTGTGWASGRGAAPGYSVAYSFGFEGQEGAVCRDPHHLGRHCCAEPHQLFQGHRAHLEESWAASWPRCTPRGMPSTWSRTQGRRNSSFTTSSSLGPPRSPLPSTFASSPPAVGRTTA